MGQAGFELGSARTADEVGMGGASFEHLTIIALTVEKSLAKGKPNDAQLERCEMIVASGGSGSSTGFSVDRVLFPSR